MGTNKYILLRECQRHALAKRLREVVRLESEAIFAETRRKLETISNPPDIPRVAQRSAVSVAQRRKGPSVETQALFWEQVFRLARYQEVLTLSNADFVRLFPHLRHPTTWIKMVRGNFGKQYPLLLERWVEILKLLIEVLDKEQPDWRKLELRFPPTDNLKQAEIRALAWQLNVARVQKDVSVRSFVDANAQIIGSWKNFSERMLAGRLPVSSLDDWLAKLRQS